jgi:hypothetical protein
MIAPTNDSKPRTLCPRGPQLCRCIWVVDIGTQHFKQGDDGSRKLFIAFETCVARHTFKEEKGPEPFLVNCEFHFYISSAGPKKTKLREFIEKWFGKIMPDDTAKNFDFSTLLGKACVITVAHAPKQDGSMKAIIADIYLPTIKNQQGQDVPMPKNMVPPAVNPLVCYEVANGEDANFAKLPEFLQKNIRKSDEFTSPPQSQATEPPDDVPMGQGAEGVADTSLAAEDCPF